MTDLDLSRLLGVPFTDEQLAAATAPPEPQVLIAGAGSGKTAVMAARVVWLVGTGQVAAEEVLGLTFTNKAAAELAVRVRAGLVRAGLAADEGEPTVSTYHAYAGRLLAEHGLRIGVEPRSRLLADATRFQLAARVLGRARGPFPSLTRPLRMLIGDLVALDADLSEHLVSPADLESFDGRLLAELTDGRRLTNDLRGVVETVRERRELVRLVVDYREAKRAMEAVDFGDQVALAARLAREFPQVGAAERARYRTVLLDEYQDTSVAQRRMLVGCFAGGHPVTAVGDPCQAIYGWRGASVSNIDAFPDHFPRRDGSASSVRPLSVNQRSGGRLLRLANALAERLRRVHRVAQLRPREQWADRGETVVALHDTYPDEMTWVAARVRAAIDDGTAPGQIAVLVRARSDFPALHAALTAHAVPVEVVGLGGLLSLPEVADVVATLELLDDATANASLIRLLTGPRWRLGPRDLAALGQRARALIEPDRVTDPAAGADAGPDEESGVDRAASGTDPCEVVALSDAVHDPGPGPYSEAGRRRLRAVAEELGRLRRRVGDPLPDLLGAVVAACGLDVELAATPDSTGAHWRQSLSAFLDVAAGFSDLDGQSSLPAFLAFLAAADAHDRGLDAVSPSGSDAVQLLTAHKAKGLEWDVAVIPNLTRGVFPGTVPRSRWTTCSYVLPYPLRGDADDMPAEPAWTTQGLAGFHRGCKDHLEREERRLAYVAVTRARRLVIASGHWWGPTQSQPRGPSSYLEELRAHCLAGNGTVLHWAAPPPVGALSPVLAGVTEQSFPPPLDPEAQHLRESAADLVRTFLREPAEGGGRPGPEGAGLRSDEAALLRALDEDSALLLAEAQAAAAGSGRFEVELPRTLSASQLVRLASDPAGLAADLVRPLPRRPVPQARRGTRFHAWVESLFGQRPLLDPDDLPGAEDAGIGDDAELAALQAAFLATGWADVAPYSVEAPFELGLAGHVVRGRIDAVYRWDRSWEVIDWKTGDEPADPVQLAVYRLAWSRLQGVDPSDVTAGFLYVRTGELVRPEPLASEAELAELLLGLVPQPN